MVLMGWYAAVFYGRAEREGGEVEYWRLPPAQWPEFDFGRFVIHFKRGLWPFLVSVAVSFAFIPVVVLCFLPVILTIATTSDVSVLSGSAVGISSGTEGRLDEVGLDEVVMTAALIFSGSLAMVMAVLANLLLAPLALRAYALQDFGRAFAFRWVRDFIGRMWREMLLVFLFNVASGIVLSLAGYMLLCVGVYFTIGIAMFSAAHLQRQMLDIFVQRGGEPLTPSPDLLDQPVSGPALWPAS